MNTLEFSSFMFKCKDPLKGIAKGREYRLQDAIVMKREKYRI